MAEAKGNAVGAVVSGLSKERVRMLYAACEAYAKSCDRFAGKAGLPDAVRKAYVDDAALARECAREYSSQLI